MLQITKSPLLRLTSKRILPASSCFMSSVTPSDVLHDILDPVDSKHGKCSIVRLNRPPVNSLNVEFMENIIATLDQVEKDSKGMILTSANKGIFCAGLDLNEMYQPEEVRLRQFWHTLQELWLRLYSLKVPTAAAINGHGPAAGTLLATCCDYRALVGSNPKATMGLNEAKFGLVAPFWFMDSFIGVVGQRIGDYSLLTGKLYNVEESIKIGLVDTVEPTIDDAMQQCLRAVSEMSKCKPGAWHMTKLQLRQVPIERLKLHREKDIDNFVELVFQEKIQKDLGAYLASLSGGGKKK